MPYIGGLYFSIPLRLTSPARAHCYCGLIMGNETAAAKNIPQQTHYVSLTHSASLCMSVNDFMSQSGQCERTELISSSTSLLVIGLISSLCVYKRLNETQVWEEGETHRFPNKLLLSPWTTPIICRHAGAKWFTRWMVEVTQQNLWVYLTVNEEEWLWKWK